METIKFKTDIKCSGCLEKVTPHLNETVGENNWQVDLQNPQKILTVSGEAQEERVKEVVQRAGFKVEKIS